MLSEGGNVVIGDEEATRLDLGLYNRSEAVKIINDALDKINNACESITGMPLWNKKLFKSKEFLSGSSGAFFQTNSIKDDEFVNVKSTIGDIDTQVDMNMKPIIEKFLDSIKGKKFGDATFIGYKDSGTQSITLWKFASFNDLNIQIDLEYVAFDENGFPTAWSAFSHSSAWADMKKGIKGVAHKYLMGALDAPRFKDMIVKAKTKRGKDKRLTRSTHSFSVSHGVREKMVPVTDDKGNIIYYDGLPQYKELSTKESFGNTDLAAIFNYFFGIEPSNEELEEMSSFVGVIELLKRHYSSSDNAKIVDAFANRLWGRSAQALYRGAPQLDLDEKSKALNYIAGELGVKASKFDNMKTAYYKNYK